jgi:integrase
LSISSAFGVIRGMARRGGAVHVATTRRHYKDTVYETHLLRRSYRENGQVKAAGASHAAVEAAVLTPQEKARAEITAHVARHVCASILRASGAGWDVIATQMGHSSGKVAEDIYVHPIEAEYVRLARQVSDYRAGLSEVEAARAKLRFHTRIAMRSEGVEPVTDSWASA